MTFEEQAVGGDNAELVLEWRHAPIGPVLLVDKHISASATDLCLELRWHPVRRGLDDATHFEVRLRTRSEEHTSELQSQSNLVCRLLLEKKNNIKYHSKLLSLLTLQ